MKHLLSILSLGLVLGTQIEAAVFRGMSKTLATVKAHKLLSGLGIATAGAAGTAGVAIASVEPEVTEMHGGEDMFLL